MSCAYKYVHGHPTHVQCLSLNTDLQLHLTFSFSMCNWKINCKKNPRKWLWLGIILLSYHLCSPPWWEISLGCATKWRPLMTEASLFVSASPSFLGSSSPCVFPPFPLIFSQDMSNHHWSQSELLTSCSRELRSLQCTLRDHANSECLLHSGNRLWENHLARFLAFHGLNLLGKKTSEMLFHVVIQNEQS